MPTVPRFVVVSGKERIRALDYISQKALPEHPTVAVRDEN